MDVEILEISFFPFKFVSGPQLCQQRCKYWTVSLGPLHNDQHAAQQQLQLLRLQYIIMVTAAQY